MYAPLQQQQPFTSQPSSYGAPYNQPFNQPVSNAMPMPMPMSNMGQSSILNPQSTANTQYAPPGLPPIEVAQQAMPQNIQRNPTPPPGWNDPPALKSSRPVSTAKFCQYFQRKYDHFIPKTN